MFKVFFKKISVCLMLLTVVFTVLTSSIFVNAEENSKTVKLTLSKDYKNCEVTISFSEAGNYSATFSDETEKNVYNFGVVDSTTMTCQVEKAKAGEWTITVTSEGNIPKFTASLDGNSDTTTAAVDDAISVGKDIVGLNVYFKDNILVAEWTDDTVGNVNVRVSNLDNSEVIAKETVTGQYFEVEIPETVKHITVGVVPSSSSSVTGAEQVFTLEVPTYPTGVNVVFPSAEYINSTEITANVSLSDTYSILVEVNGSEVYESSNNGAGEHEVPIELLTGSNTVVLYVIDIDGNMFSQTKDYVVDVTAPELSLEGDYDNLTTYDDTFVFGGTISDYETFVINEENIVPASDGTWSYTASLHLGENTVNIKAIDLAGNITEYNFVVQMLEETVDYTKYYVTAVVILVVIVVAIVIYFKKHPREPKEEKKHKGSEVKTSMKAKPVKERKGNKFTEMFSSKKKVVRFLIDWVLPIVAVIYVLTFVLFGGVVVSGSMEPTLMTGSVEFGNRLAYVNHDIERGDIIYFKYGNEIAGKRVIGIAGDSIEFYDGDVYLNGEKLEEDYLAFDTDTNCSQSFIVPEGKLFVMGDNRENSNDSRFWDDPYVDVSDVIAKYLISTPPWFAKLYS